jgi:beta-lactam-binding protein with PASTA domain
MNPGKRDWKKNGKRNGLPDAKRLAFMLCAMLPLCALPVMAQQTLKSGYTFTDLGTLGTDTMSNALAINNAGQVVGVSTATIPDALSIINYAEGDYGYGADYQFYYGNAYIWNPDTPNAAIGTLVRLALLPGLTCTNPDTGLPIPRNDAVWDINANGVAVGSSNAYLTDCQTTYVMHGVSWSNGALTDLGVPTGDTNPTVQSEAKSINDLGQIVGDWALSSAWSYNGGLYSILGSVNTSLVNVAKINNAGTIVGSAGNLGFIHNGTGPLLSSDLIGTLGGTSSGAFSINQTGMVVGNSYLGSSPAGSHAFLIDPFQVPLNSGNMQDLGVASSDPSAYSSATAINNNANHLAVIIVGYSIVDPNAYWLSPQHAVMWQNIHNIIDLNTLLDPSMQPPYNTLSPCANPSGCWELMTANGVNDKGQIVGEALFVRNGQSDGVLHGYLLSPPCATAGGDSDGDGLCDDWEINGYTFPDGTKIDLPAMGADPNHKDVFVHLDYLFGSDHTHMLKPEANLALVQAFANSPVSNPDGKTGINLHIDCGPTCIMNPLTGESWGTSGSTQSFSTGFPEGPHIPFGSAGASGTWNDAQLLQFFNTADPSGAFDMEYSQYRYRFFHFALMAHSIGGFPGPQVTLGFSGTTPGSWLVTGLALANSDPPVGSALLQAIVLMHELGHNLGLQHGGLDGVNYKPNYLSIMNYAFSSYGLYNNGGTGLLDYSRFPSIPSLNKQSLNEAAGLNGGPAIAGFGTRYYCPGGIQGTSTGLRNVANANGPIDWNCDGNATETGVNANINADPSSCSIIGSAATTLCFTLYGTDDWNHLIFRGGTIGADQAQAVANSNLLSSEPGIVPDTVPVVPYLVEVASSGIAQVNPGANLNLTFTITNKGLNEDTYDLTFSTEYNWYNPVNLLGAVTLASGASQQIIVPVIVPANFGCQNLNAIKALFSLKAVSQTYPIILDAGYAELDVEPVPGTAIVPALFGLTQSAAQTSIVNAGLAVGTVTTEYDQYYAAGTIINQSPSSCLTAAAGSAVNLTVSLGAQYFTVPSLVGTNESGVSAAITTAGLIVGTITPQMSASVPEFTVISQTPAAGSQVLAGTVVNVVFSESNVHLVQVPDLVDAGGIGFPYIAAAGLTVGTLTPTLSATVQTPYLISQNPPAGAFVPIGTPVNLVYSAGPAMVAVPNVVGQWQWTASDNLFNAVDFNNHNGLFSLTITRQASTTVPDGGVISQSPAGGTPAVPTSTVNLVVSSGGPVTAVVPDLVADPSLYGSLTNTTGVLNFAGNVILSAGFSVGTITPQYSNAHPLGTTTTLPNTLVPKGYIVSQTPAAGTVAPWDTSINLVVSAGAPLTLTIPNVVGLTESAAVSLLNQGLPNPQLGDYWTYTFTTQTSATVPAGTIMSQNPPAGPAYMSLYGNREISPINMIISAGPNNVPTYSFSKLLTGVGNTYDLALASVGLTGGGGATGKGILSAYGMALDPISRDIIVGDGNSGTLQVFDLNGQFKRYFGGTGIAPTLVDQEPGEFQDFWESFFPGESNGNGLLVGLPAAIAVDPVSENIVVVDFYGNRALIYNSGGQFLSAFGSFGSAPGQFTFDNLVGFPGVAVDPATENIFVTDTGNNRVQVFNSSGVYLSQFGTFGTGNGQFSAASGIAIDPVSHNILVADWGNSRIQMFNAAGTYLSQFGTYGQGDGQFDSPTLIAIDPVSRNIIVTDRNNNRAQIFDLNGNFLSKFGGQGGSSGDFAEIGFANNSSSIAVDPLNRNIIVATLGSIQVFSLQNGAAATTITVTSSLDPANAGQSVALTATVTGNNPTGTVQFMDGASGLGSPVILSTGVATLTTAALTAGTHPITAVYSGDGSNSGSSSAILNEVINQPAAPPVVTPPPAITISATQSTGTTSSASPTLAAFLASATATSTLSTAPVQLAPQVGGLAVTGSTVFPLGTTTVTFSFQDSDGNVGTALSTVTVSLGTPRITGTTAGIGMDPSGAIYVNVVLTNTGTGNAQNLQIKTLTLRTLSGTGTVIYNTTLSPALPLTLGNLSVGASVTTTIYLNVPSTVARISITEGGPVQDVAGGNYNYSTAEGVVP